MIPPFGLLGPNPTVDAHGVARGLIVCVFGSPPGAAAGVERRDLREKCGPVGESRIGVAAEE